MFGSAEVKSKRFIRRQRQNVFRTNPKNLRVLPPCELSLFLDNAILQRIAYGLYNLGFDIRRRATVDPAIIAQSTKDHARIVEAICARDETRAGEAMKTHLAHIEASTRRFAALSPDPPIQTKKTA